MKGSETKIILNAYLKKLRPNPHFEVTTFLGRNSRMLNFYGLSKIYTFVLNIRKLSRFCDQICTCSF